MSDKIGVNMCRFHWHSKDDKGCRKTLEHLNKHANNILKMIRREKPVYEINGEYNLQTGISYRND
jgi:hypothetical protein